MGYLHIDNLYKNQTVLQFKEVYVLEKIHGTSAHIAWSDGALRFFTGDSHANFVKLFDSEALARVFTELFGADSKVVIYGEHFGGKIQGCRHLYGEAQRFSAFDVKVGDTWLSVPNAHEVATKLGVAFVAFEKVECRLSELDRFRDLPSFSAQQAGIPGKTGEGCVIRPLQEFTDNRGNRVIAKHKRDDYRETATPRKVVDPSELKVLEDAEAVATEWVTAMRLEHVLQKLPEAVGLEHTGSVVKAMQDDVKREGEGELVWDKETEKAVGKKAAVLFKAKVATLK